MARWLGRWMAWRLGMGLGPSRLELGLGLGRRLGLGRWLGPRLWLGMGRLGLGRLGMGRRLEPLLGLAVLLLQPLALLVRRAAIRCVPIPGF